MLPLIVFLFVTGLIVGGYFAAMPANPANRDLDRRRDIPQAAIEAAGGLHRRQPRRRGVSAKHQRDDRDEHEDRQQHQRTSVTPSNMSAGR